MVSIPNVFTISMMTALSRYALLVATTESVTSHKQTEYFLCEGVGIKLGHELVVAGLLCFESIGWIAHRTVQNDLELLEIDMFPQGTDEGTGNKIY